MLFRRRYGFVIFILQFAFIDLLSLLYVPQLCKDWYLDGDLVPRAGYPRIKIILWYAAGAHPAKSFGSEGAGCEQTGCLAPITLDCRKHLTVRRMYIDS